MLRLGVMIRQAGPQDVRFLRDMLKHAYHWRLNEDPDLPVARYVNNWGRPGDAGLVAWEAGPIGAAWYRLFPAAEPGYGFVDERTPELAIAVVPSKRGHGIGDALLRGLLDKAQQAGYPAISLSVDAQNAGAVRLYERHGFERTADDGDSVTMVARLS